jgi:hypothetical protein
VSQPDRETVYAALMSVLTANLPANTFNIMSRRIQQVENVDPANMPALFQVQKEEDFVTLKGVPSLRQFDASLVIYVDFGDDQNAIPSTPLNAKVTAVENALGPSAVNAFLQIGVPVSSCYINGKIEYYEGVLGNKCVAIIPVRIMANY